MKSSGGRNIPEGATVCRNPQCVHGYHFGGKSCRSTAQTPTSQPAVKIKPLSSQATNSDNENLNEVSSIDAALETLSINNIEVGGVHDDGFDPLNFTQYSVDTVTFAGVGVMEEESYGMAEVETMWEISLTETPPAPVPLPPNPLPPPPPTYNPSAGNWWPGGVLHRNTSSFFPDFNWLRENGDKLLEPIYYGRNLNVDELYKSLQQKIQTVGGIGVLQEYLVEKINNSETLEEELQHLKLFSIINSNSGSPRFLPSGKKLPVYIYRQMSERDNSETFTKTYIDTLDADANSVEGLFSETPLTKKLGIKIDEQLAETLIEEHITKVEGVINKKPNMDNSNTPTTRWKAEGRLIEARKWGLITTDDVLQTLKQLEQFTPKGEGENGNKYSKNTMEKVKTIFESVPDVDIEKLAKLVPESKINLLYLRGNVMMKRVAIAAASSPDQVYEMLTKLTTHNEGKKMTRKEREEVEKSVVKTIVFGTPNKINEDSLRYIIKKWGSDKEINEHLAYRILNKDGLNNIKHFGGRRWGLKTLVGQKGLLKELKKAKRNGFWYKIGKLFW